MKNLSFLILIISFFSINTFNCGHNLIKNRPIKIINPIEKEEIRKLQSTKHYISIYVDYEVLESQLNSGEINSSYYLNLSLSLNKTVHYFSKILAVNSPKKLKLAPQLFNTENDYIIRSEVPYITSNVIETDLILIPKVYFIGEGIDAAAYAIALSAADNRPVAGGVLLGTHYDFSEKNSQKFLIMLLLHEITHVLGFSNGLFEFFNTNTTLTMKKKINGIDRILFKGNNVLKQAKRHFACDSIEGIELEDQGGSGSAGSHWEARIMLGDYMISTDYPEIVISEISLGLLEDSGWYDVNYYTGGLFRYGKGLGCSFLNNTCVSNGETIYGREFCVVPGEERCSASNIDRGFCYITTYSSQLPSYYQYFSDKRKGGFIPADYCPVSISYASQNYYFYSRCDSNGKNMNNINPIFGEIYGNNSICVLSSLSPKNYSIISSKQSRCHEIQCDNITRTFTIDIGDVLLNCSGVYEEVSVTGYSGSIICPDYNRVCTGSVLCNDPLDCIDNNSLYDEADDTSVANVTSKDIGMWFNKKDILKWILTFSYIIF